MILFASPVLPYMYFEDALLGRAGTSFQAVFWVTFLVSFTGSAWWLRQRSRRRMSSDDRVEG